MVATALPLLACLAVASAELRLVNVLFRHGPRTPADTYPNDPFINFDFPPFGWGQLTNNGKLTQFQQGEWLRQRYGKFLGDKYSPDIIVAQSTGVDRTQMSAQLELAGLLPPNEDQKWDPNLNWQPIPVHYQPLEHDDLLLVRVPCPRYYEELSKVMKSAEVQENLVALNAASLYVNLTEITGLQIKTPDDVQSLYSTLKAEEDFPLELPKWTKEYYPDKLAPLTAYSFILNAYNQELRKLKGGPLLKKIITDIKSKVDGATKEANRKFFMYAGHDSTVSNLLLALGVWDEQIPSYGIMTMIELHQNEETKEHYVQLYLRNSTLHEPYALVVPGCKHACPLETFLSLTADVIPQDLKEECQAEDPNYEAPTAAPP